MQRFQQVPLVGVHVVLDRPLPGSRSVEIERDPAGVILLAQDAEEGWKIHAAATQAFVEVYAVVLLFARRWTLPPMTGVVLGLAVFQMDRGHARVVIAKGLHGIDAA